MAENPEFYQWMAEAGLSTGLLGVLIWIVRSTFKQFNETSVKAFEAIEAMTRSKDDSIKVITEAKDQQAKDSFEAHVQLSNRMLDLMQKNHDEEAEQKDLILRILSRMEERLNQPVRCPAQLTKE